MWGDIETDHVASMDAIADEDAEFVMGVDVGVKNLALCVINKGTQEIVAWELLNCLQDGEAVPTASECVARTSQKLHHLLATQMHKSIAIERLTAVGVEAQPFGASSMANNKMRSVQAAIESAVAIALPQVKCSPISPQSKRCTGASYTERKRDAVRQAGEHILGTPWEAFFNTHGKKDDLADAFLIARAMCALPKRKRKRRAVRKEGADQVGVGTTDEP
tara:strand:+ start:9325 stop:9984 length:660 start_codon:yes stop_codon:yes gene_type:complete